MRGERYDLPHLIDFFYSPVVISDNIQSFLWFVMLHSFAIVDREKLTIYLLDDSGTQKIVGGVDCE